MPTDLSNQIRSLIDVAEQVSAHEVLERTRTTDTPINPMKVSARWRAHRPLLVAASTIALVGASLGWGLSAMHSGPNHRVARTTPPSRVILTATEVHRIASRSTDAAALSGTAQVTETSSQNGTPQSSNSVAVTFDGTNIDEKITVNPEPAGSAASFATDDRLVDGQFYIYTPGPGDVPEWLHDTNSTNDASSMQFPDPRTLYAALSPNAEFEVVGTSGARGLTLTELRALDPAAIETGSLGNLAQGTLTAFEMTIDENDVVQQMTFASSATVHGCLFRLGAAERKELKAELEKEGVTGPIEAVSLPALHAAENATGIKPTCEVQTTTSQVTVDFANLGVPQSVVAPQGAVDFAGKG